MGTTSFTVTVTDGETPAKTATANLSIAISATTLNVVTSPAPPIGVINSAYSTTLQATGGVSPYTLWTVVSGNLPTGLSLDQSGNITGTPTTTGSYSFVVQATTNQGVSNLQQFVMIIGTQRNRLGDSDAAKRTSEPEYLH